MIAAVDRERLAEADVMHAGNRVGLADDLRQRRLDELMVRGEIDVRARAREDVDADAVGRRQPVDELPAASSGRRAPSFEMFP